MRTPDIGILLSIMGSVGNFLALITENDFKGHPLKYE